ncbi:aminoglycoside phosphotransferase [Microlunatus sp. Gsoil 973]|uniref:aminoglycoside phosphotransferase n=1 Tax=Microlunatus sp. Gsoil 973 TaxID=2672569 RepID=UPI0012B47562|nr:aminoglycoside phosphotransferase [Microlunatus sp. Gsoil 973]QGN32594.1 aminoglycoside phosphotransferase [Microlunatus sp. Gsoil 973]
MNEPPADLDIAEFLRLVQRSWDASVDELTHLSVGFGAHHWRADVRGSARYFVTLDGLGERHTVETLRAAYAGAAALARTGLTFVAAPIEPFAVPLEGGAVSVTPWLDGTPVAVIDTGTTAAMLRQLHAVDLIALGVELPPWQPVVGPDLPERLAEWVRHRWAQGPYGERSRAAVVAARDDIGRWTDRYFELAQVARTRPWVATHGEPGMQNQMITASGTVLVDWESLKLAPAERDLRTIECGDRLMLELFDLEWRLDEINQYTAWFAGPHGDTTDDRVAFEDFMHELTR